MEPKYTGARACVNAERLSIRIRFLRDAAIRHGYEKAAFIYHPPEFILAGHAGGAEPKRRPALVSAVDTRTGTLLP